ncbi:filamentous hemagglutinin N-terminal domain-containing protein [Leptothermofonsia sichuanensis E412]|uniref:two-partner secretion domain-containing protein n=1 Tax=Leptothermofonsia sichuanensis TaxID=2917832 RepID=UPI001CA77C55|nr:filamentous hemagglutinin N-terminal domain-containing protein [Leptothermofonsia sichuanensis]QZZ20532.1 filamentous hemagglutinin N-terminal domain-containing protein [Leptothermofonsia sichuanensis E412]
MNNEETPQRPLIRQRLWSTVLILTLGEMGTPGFAQLVPDGTLGTQSSTVRTSGSTDIIEGGVRAGRNLFHSFQELNVDSGRSLYFQDPGVSNILTRVTGSNPSSINGKLGVLGNANLFLLNPNGIIFGSSARLGIRGSFVASTASAIKFADGSEFRATPPQVAPLLTVSLPIGLQRGNQPAAFIINRGNLAVGQDLTLDADRLDLQGQMQAGRNLTLLATDTVYGRDKPAVPFLAQAGQHLKIQGDRGIDILTLNHPNWIPFQSGGNLSLLSDGIISGDARFASQGNVQIQSISAGLATFTSLYDPIISSTGDVDLALNYSGASLLVEAGGNIRIQGSVDITTPDVAAPFVGDDAILNREPGLILRSGQTALRYAGSSDPIAGSTTGSGLVSEPGITLGGDVTVASGGVVRLTTEGNGDIRTQVVRASQGAISLTSTGGSITSHGQFFSVATGSGNAGSIQLNAPRGDVTTGRLIAYSDDPFTSGNGGSIAVIAGRNAMLGEIDTWSTAGDGASLSVTAGQAISTRNIITYSYIDGDSGDVTMTAGGPIALSSIDTSADGGRSGAVRITTLSEVTVRGAIDTSTYGSGQGGAIEVQAGGDVRLLDGSTLRSDTFTSGQAGDVAVSARSLFLEDGAQIRSVSRYGAIGGNGGTITLNVADTIKLSGVGSGDRPSAIFSLADLYSTGNGGNITIYTGSLIMRDGSEILANHFGEGVGTRAGNITIRATDLISLEGFRVRVDKADSPGSGIGSNVSTGLDSVRGINRQGGTIDIRAGALELLNGGYISSSLELEANGQGGNILIDVSRQGVPGTVVIAGSATRQTGIFSRTMTDSVGNGGNIQLNAGTVSLQDNGIIGAETNGAGNGGRIYLNTTSLSVSRRSAISAETTTAGNAGEITLLSDRLTLTDGGQIRSETSSSGQAGVIQLGRPDLPIHQVTLRGRGSAILAGTQPGSSGNGGNITLFAGDVSVQEQARISAETSGQGTAGNISLQATGSVAIEEGLIASGVAANARGNGGEIVLAARSVRLINRGQIQTLTLGSGKAGDIQVQADRIAIADPFSGIISGSSNPVQRGTGIGDGGNIRLTAGILQVWNDGIVSASTFSDGRSGTIDVTTGILDLTSEGKLSATTQSRGDAGSIRVFASDRVTIAGARSGLFANTTFQSSGNGGSIFLTTDRLRMQDRGRITVDSEGRGRGGDIQLAADQIDLDRSVIFAETASSNGGNVQIQVRDLLLLRHNSLISASAGTAQAGGNGGNIWINAGFVVGVLKENSDIRANAFTGNGGRVNIWSQGIFGLRFQPRPTPISDITASSQYGFSGTVTLSTLDSDPNRGLVNLPETLTDSSHQMTQTCTPQQQGNYFIVTGRGGLSPDPAEALNQTLVWVDGQSVQGQGNGEESGRTEPGKAEPGKIMQTVSSREVGHRRRSTAENSSPSPIVEITGWIRNMDGSIVLVADTGTPEFAIATQPCQSPSLGKEP